LSPPPLSPLICKYCTLLSSIPLRFRTLFQKLIGAPFVSVSSGKIFIITTATAPQHFWVLRHSLAPLVIAPIVLVFPTLSVIVVEAPQITHPLVCSASPTPFASTFSPTGIPWKLNLETSVLLRLTRSLSPTLLDLHCTTDPTTNIDLAFCTTIIPVPHSMEFFPLLLLAFQLVEEGPLYHRFL
jgi:hypothetical protein